ncbi:hypothetical protein GH733_010151 [Mirounga leonina]|nr:hypothetical protein GH733_010151 [Mirounga leonina]
MNILRLLLATLLVSLCFLTAYSHLAPEEKPRDDRSLRSNSSMNLLDFPSVSIVVLNKKPKKISRKEAEKKRSSKRVDDWGRQGPLGPLVDMKSRGQWCSGWGWLVWGLHCPRSSQADVRTGGVGVAGLGSPGASPQKEASMKNVARPRPPPPSPCVATRDSCKSPAPACCDPCASCQCRFFRSVCSCRVLSRLC